RRAARALRREGDPFRHDRPRVRVHRKGARPVEEAHVLARRRSRSPAQSDDRLRQPKSNADHVRRSQARSADRSFAPRASVKAWLAVLLLVGCGARTDLGAPRPIRASDAGSDVVSPPAIACVAKEKAVLSKGTTTNADVRIDSAFVYWNDGARIVRAPKNGSLTPEVVVDAAVDLGAWDVSPSGVVFSAHGETQVRRSDGAVLGVVSRPSVEVLAASGSQVYVVAPQGTDEALFAIASGT